MITFLHGAIVEKQPTSVVLEVGGVGYEVLIPLSSYDRLPRRNESCRILTVDYVREDQHVLFGFMTEEERRLFLLLLGASGIGPKLALSALSGLSVRDLKTAVVEGDVKRISSISGIGKKMAERIVVELRHRIGPGEALEAVAGADAPPAADGKVRDAVMALVALGFKQDDARKKAALVVGTADGASLSVEDIVKRCLGG
jgi:Holliday junction DNA helicase RuvA